MDRWVSVESLLAEKERSSARGGGQISVTKHPPGNGPGLTPVDPGRRILEGSGLHQGEACREDSFPLIVLFPLPSWALLMVPWLGWTQHSPDQISPIIILLLSDGTLTELSRTTFSGPRCGPAGRGGGPVHKTPRGAAQPGSDPSP